MNLQMLNKATKRHEMEVSLSEWGTVTGILEISSNISSSVARRGLRGRC